MRVAPVYPNSHKVVHLMLLFRSRSWREVEIAWYLTLAYIRSTAFSKTANTMSPGRCFVATAWIWFPGSRSSKLSTKQWPSILVSFQRHDQKMAIWGITLRINRPKLEMVTGRRQAVQLDLSGWSHHGDGSKVSRSVSEVQQYIRGKIGTNIHITTEQKNNKIF